MKAIRVTEFGGANVLKLVTKVPIPTPGNNQILVKVRAAGVNPVDTYVRAGTFDAKHPLPYTPGFDVSGVVDKVGDAVKNFKVGDRVHTVNTVSGGYAEYAVVEEPCVAHLPDNVTFDQGAAIGIPMYTAYKALIFNGKGRPGETVLIHGASGGSLDNAILDKQGRDVTQLVALGTAEAPSIFAQGPPFHKAILAYVERKYHDDQEPLSRKVGVAACQIARGLGFRVLGTAGTRAGLELAKNNGAHEVFNHREEGYLNKIKDATHGEGPDVILEMLANVNLEKDLNLIKTNGRIVTIGSRGTVEMSPVTTMMKQCIVTGVIIFSTTLSEWREMHAALYAGLEKGWLKPHIGKSYKLEEASQSHEDIMQDSGHTGRLIIKT